jgi:GT2 family glycosyltransferase
VNEHPATGTESVPPLSVVVVNWNSKGDLEACLRSLREQTLAGIEVIVVDNGSTDGSVEMVRERFPGVRLLAEGENLGFAEGCNRGIRASRAPWVATLNNDAVAEPDWAEHLMREADRAAPTCGMLQSLMLFMGQDGVVNSTGIELTREGGRDRHEGQQRSQSVQPEEIFCPTAGAAAYRRSMLDQVELERGWFDTAHFMYFEDLDLGWRARLAGWTALYVPASVVHHRYHGSSARRGRTWLLKLARTNRLRTLLKNASWRYLLATSRITAKELSELVRLTRSEAPRTVGEALWSSLRSRRKVSAFAVESRTRLEKRWMVR